jgi:glutamate-1-semialdehyde 2,1-aminomutase
MLKHGIYLAPSAYEAGFTSIKHDENIIQATLEAAEIAFRKKLSL